MSVQAVCAARSLGGGRRSAVVMGQTVLVGARYHAMHGGRVRGRCGTPGTRTHAQGPVYMARPVVPSSPRGGRRRRDRPPRHTRHDVGRCTSDKESWGRASTRPPHVHDAPRRATGEGSVSRVLSATVHWSVAVAYRQRCTYSCGPGNNRQLWQTG